MAVLKKIKASTLMETLVATVLIVVLFMVASGIMNGLLRSQASVSEAALEQQWQLLRYQYEHGKLTLPHIEKQGDWDLELTIRSEDSNPVLHFRATQEDNTHEFERTAYATSR